MSDRLAMVLGGAEALSGRLWLEASTRAAAQPRRSSMLGRGHERVRGALACLRRVARVCGPQYVAIHLRDPKFREAHEFRKLVRTNIETKVFEKTKHFENRFTAPVPFLVELFDLAKLSVANPCKSFAWKRATRTQKRASLLWFHAKDSHGSRKA